MPTLIVYEDEKKQARLVLEASSLGNESEPWNPIRTEIKVLAVKEGAIKSFKMGNKLEEVSIDEKGRLIVLQDKLPKPRVSEDYDKEPIPSRTIPSHIAFVTTKEERSGIYTYTKYLADAVGKLFPVKVHASIPDIGSSALCHTQHEFGIFPYVDELVGSRLGNIYRVVTLHTALDEPGPLLEHYYRLDQTYDALVVHTHLQKKFLRAYVKGQIHVIPHGSYIFEPMRKEKARAPFKKAFTVSEMKGKWVFVFGFASDSKGFDEIVEVAKKMPDTLFIISAAIHGIVSVNSERVEDELKEWMKGTSNILRLGRFLDESEINMWLSACDCILFNYKTPAFIGSASGALHRCLAAGKPIVCPEHDNRMLELEDGKTAFKFTKGDLEGMKDALELALLDDDIARQIGKNVRAFAEETSWDKIAKKHMEVYGKVVGDLFGPAWYDSEYYAGLTGGKSYFTADGEEKKWSYYNPKALWAGANPVMKAIKELFEPISLFSVGEGRGTFLVAAKEVGIKQVYGIDFSYWAVNNPHPDAVGLLEWGDVRDLSKWEDNSFDVVIAFDVMEHVYIDELDKAISEIQRVTKKWIFYNNGSTLHKEEGTMVLKKGEFPPKEMQGTSLAGHVTVMPCDWWEKKLTNEHNLSRPILVQQFRIKVNNVNPEILTNWHCLIITEKV